MYYVGTASDTPSPACHQCSSDTPWLMCMMDTVPYAPCDSSVPLHVGNGSDVHVGTASDTPSPACHQCSSDTPWLMCMMVTVHWTPVMRQFSPTLELQVHVGTGSDVHVGTASDTPSLACHQCSSDTPWLMYCCQLTNHHFLNEQH